MNLPSEKYIFVSNEDSIDYFPENTPTKFTSLVNLPLEIYGTWMIGLCEIFVEFDTFKETKDIHQPGGGHVIFDVFLRQATGTMLNGQESNIIRRVTGFLRNRILHTYHVIFDNPYFVKLKGNSLAKLEVDIKMVHPENLAFRSKTSTRATLLVKKFN